MWLHCGVVCIDEHFLQTDTPFFVATQDMGIGDPIKKHVPSGLSSEVIHVDSTQDDGFRSMDSLFIT